MTSVKPVSPLILLFSQNLTCKQGSHYKIIDWLLAWFPPSDQSQQRPEYVIVFKIILPDISLVGSMFKSGFPLPQWFLSGLLWGHPEFINIKPVQCSLLEKMCEENTEGSKAYPLGFYT